MLPSVRTKYVELFIDNDYRGVYLLVESIKRDKARINIAKLGPGVTDGLELTGGYIVRIDKESDSKCGWESIILPQPWAIK
ncbi:MAG: CotH kinase family protein [Bacteroidetes bacterium]|nr:CotH kinase family protein [Bacteroidota bacterium]